MQYTYGIWITTSPRASCHWAPILRTCRSLARKSRRYIWRAISPHVKTFRDSNCWALTEPVDSGCPSASFDEGVLLFPSSSSASRIHHTPHPARPSFMKSERKVQNLEKRDMSQGAGAKVFAAGALVLSWPEGMRFRRRYQCPRSRMSRFLVCAVGLYVRGDLRRAVNISSVGVMCVVKGDVDIIGYAFLLAVYLVQVCIRGLGLFGGVILHY